MASSQHNTKFIFGEEDIINDNKNDEKSSDDEGYNQPLLETNLIYDTTPGYSLSFSHSHSYSYSHGDINFNNINDNNNNYNNNNSINNSLPFQDSDLLALKEWLISHSLQNIYKKLVAAGYDSTDIFIECDDDDIKQIATDHNLSTSQRLKLKKAIRSLKKANDSNINININNSISTVNNICKKRKINNRRNVDRLNSIIITEKQKLKMLEISNYLENMDECYKIIENKLFILENEKKSKENDICKEFSIMFNTLHERRTNLMNELHFIYQKKKDIFEQTLNKFNKIIENTKNIQQECSKLILSQSIKNYEENIKKINQIENKIINNTNKCLCKIGPIDINTKINIDLKTKDYIQIFNVIGDINEDYQSHEELTYNPLEHNQNNNNNNDNYDNDR